MKKCEKCGTENADEIMYCTTCGTQLKIAAEPVAAPTPAPTPTTAFAPTPAPVAPAASAKKMDGKTIGLIAAAAVGLIVGIVGIVVAIAANNKKPETPAPSQNTNVSGGDEVTVATVSGNNTGTTVKVGPYTMTVPKEYPFETTDDGVIITDPTNSVWAASIMYDDSATYSQVSSNLKKLGEYYTGQGAKNVKTGTAKTGALNYLYVDMITPDDGFAKTLAIFKADTALFDVVVTDGTTVANHGIIDIVAPIIANAKSGKTANRDLGFSVTTKGVETLKIDEAFENMDQTEE